jgi:hypothetical protein
MISRSVSTTAFALLLASVTSWNAIGAQADDVDAAQRMTNARQSCDKHKAEEATTVKSSKSNSSERLTAPAPPAPMEASNLNLSKSNVDRKKQDQASGETGDSDC